MDGTRDGCGVGIKEGRGTGARDGTVVGAPVGGSEMVGEGVGILANTPSSIQKVKVWYRSCSKPVRMACVPPSPSSSMLKLWYGSSSGSEKSNHTSKHPMSGSTQ